MISTPLITSFPRILGWSALSGVAVIVVTYALNYPLATYNISVRSNISLSLQC